MSATIVNETTYTVWCGECPFSTDPTIYREQAERIQDQHNARYHRDPDLHSKLFPNGTPVGA